MSGEAVEDELYVAGDLFGREGDVEVVGTNEEDDGLRVEGEDIVVVQAKFERLGMYLMGQAFFSAQLMQRFRPRSVESVALVAKDDEVLRPLFEQYAGMRVVVYPGK